MFDTSCDAIVRVYYIRFHLNPLPTGKHDYVTALSMRFHLVRAEVALYDAKAKFRLRRLEYWGKTRATCSTFATVKLANLSVCTRFLPNRIRRSAEDARFSICTHPHEVQMPIPNPLYTACFLHLHHLHPPSLSLYERPSSDQTARKRSQDIRAHRIRSCRRLFRRRRAR